MPPASGFRETIQEQLADPDFRCEFLREAVSNMVVCDLDTPKSVPRECTHGALGWIAVGEALSKSPQLFLPNGRFEPMLK